MVVVPVIAFLILGFVYHDKIDFEKSLKSRAIAWQSKLAIYVLPRAAFVHVLFPPNSDSIGLMIHDIKIINDSDDEVRNIKEIVLRYRIDGKTKETRPTDMLTHTMYSPQRKTNVQYIRLIGPTGGVVFEDWKNINDVAVDNSTLPSKGVLRGSAVFQFYFYTAKTLNNVSNPQLVVKEYSGKETFIDLTTDDWSKDHVDQLAIVNTMECTEKECHPPR